MLVLARKPDEAILLEVQGVRIRILAADVRLGGRSVRGQVRLAVEAPPEVTVWREELGEFRPERRAAPEDRGLRADTEPRP